jgi:hypothetical protein
VVFIAHFERGFALPMSDFFRDFLDYFDLQPHHLPANAVMTLSAFAAFCEGYADIEPFVQGWSKYFQLWKQSSQEPRDKNAPPETAKEKKERPMTQCGAATIMSQKGSDFPKIELLESCKKWQKTFFYVKNTTAVDLINLPEYVDVPPTEMKNWTFNPRSLVSDPCQYVVSMMSSDVKPALVSSPITRWRSLTVSTKLLGLKVQFFISVGGTSTYSSRLIRSTAVVFFT